MFRRRGWLAVSAIWIILALQDPATGGVLYSGKNPRGIISRKNRIVGQENVEKNSWTLTERNGQEIYMNQLELGSSQVSGPTDTLGLKVGLGSRKSRIKKSRKNEGFFKLDDFHSSGLKFEEEKLPYSREDAGTKKGRASGEGGPPEAKKYAEHKWQITQVGSPLNEVKTLVQRGKRDTPSFDQEKLNRGNSRRPRYEKDDSKSNKYEEPTLISNVAGEPASIRSEQSYRLHRKSFEPGNEKAYLSVGGGGEKLKDRSRRASESGMVEDDDESEGLGVSDKKMQPHERLAPEKKIRENKVEKELEARGESIDFITAASGKAEIVGDGEPMGESFNDSNAETGSTKNVSSDSYGVSGNQRKVKNSTSTSSTLPGEKSTWLYQRVRDGKKHTVRGFSRVKTTPLWGDLTMTKKNDDYSISGGTHRANIKKGESGPSKNRDELNADSQEAIKCIGKTKFNKKLPIGLSAVNYAGYIETERSDSNIKRNPVPKHKIEESYRRTDVARDMRREGDAAVAVANELAYSDTGFNAAQIPESVVQKIGVNDYGEIGLISAPVPGSDISGSLISHTTAVAIQSESHGIRESSNSQLIKDELLTTSWEEIHPRGEINDDQLNDLLQVDGKLSDISETIAMNNINNKKFEAVENRDIDSRQVIGGENHVQRKSLKKIASVYNSEKGNEHLGIIETLNGEFLRDSEKETVNEDKDRNEMTTTLNIRAMGTVGNSWRYKNEKSKKKPRDIRLVKSSSKVNAAEISEEENLSNVENGENGSPRIRIPNFLANQRDADIEITRPEKTELLNTEPRGYGNDTDEFQFIVPNSRPIQGGKIERNEDVEGGTIDVEGKSSGNLLSDIRRDGKVIRNSKFIVQNSEKLQDKVNRDENSLLTVIKIDKTFGIEDTRAKVTGKQVTNSINLPHVSPRLFQSYTEAKTTGYTEININTSPGRTAMTEPSARNGITQGLSLTVNLLAGKKNDAKLRGEVNRGGTVSRTMGKKKTNLLDKLLGSKPEVGNLSALDISGYGGYLTERIYFELDTENNDRDKLPKKIAARPEVLVVEDKEKQTFSKLKQSRKFPVEISDDTEITTPRFLQAAILSDKYLASKNKRAMKTSGLKINPEFSTDEKMTKKIVGAEETTVSLLKNLEDEASKAGNVSVEEMLIAVNKSETSTETVAIFSPSKATGRIREDSPAKFTENNTRLFSRSFRGASESGTTTKNSVQSVQLFPENGDPVSGTENSYQFDNSTEMNVFSENRGSIFDDHDNAATENPAFSDLQTIGYESNQTYSNDVNDSIATRKVLEVLTPLNSDLVDQDILSYFPTNLIPTEIPLKTTLDIFEAIAQSFNPPFNFNQTDLENTSRVSTALNQWPVKHSAVVEGDLVLGGLMMVHEREDSVTCGPVMPQGGVQALEAMLYTLDRLNQEEIIPGVKIGAHILDDCDKDTYGLEMAVDFIKGSISNIDGAEYHCNKTAVRKVISGVVGAASSVTSIQVANLLRLFRIPQVSFFSTSPELSNKQRFEYFTRTIPSDHYQVKAMVDIVKMMNWSYVSIIYEESNYGIKAFEELEELLSKYDICIAIKEKLVKDSGVAEETAYDNIVQKLLTKPRARGCIIFGSDQEVAGVMRAVRRCNATGAFSWIGSDGWSARGLVSDGNEPEVEGTLSVQPQANPVKGFEKYFLDLTVENNRRNPWFVEFWEDHFQCRYPNASWTPYNQKYTKPCTTKERLSKQNTAFEDQLQFVSDAVTAFAYAFRDMHRELCFGKPGLCDAMKPTKGTELLKYLRKVDFEGLSGDKFRFDKNGDGPARYNIIHFKQASPGKYKWVRVGEYMEGELRLNRSEIQFRLGHPLPPESVCSLPCEVGQAKKYVEGESCCWHCFNCTQYQVRHPLDETQCIPCPKGSLPDETHSDCRDIPEEFLRPESGWAIGAMSFSATGILVTLFVGGVFLRHNDTPVVRASGRELSYVLLTGILLCYLVTFALVLRPNNIVCGIQRFGAGFCFTVVYAALLTKTNRISRIFNAGKQSAKRPSFISPRSQLIICSGLMGIQILINGVWMIIDPAKAMYHYPTREDNLLVCSSYIDASYMIAFSYPIILIVVCTVYAVLTRKIPEAFNESKHIGFTMYTTCVIWLAFVPLYFGTGNHVALRITSMSVTISLSASVTIACLFSPKLYIILIRPERNVRQSMMPARYSTTKSSAVTGTNASSMMAAVTLTAATCDQNKAVKRHVTTTIDCSTQSEHYEMEVKEDRINGKTTGNYISRSTQTQVSDSADTNPPSRVAGIPISITKDNITSKEIIKDSTSLQGKQLNNVRIGNGPVSQKDGAL